MSIRTRIEEKLQKQLHIHQLEVRDDSAQHQGHAGHREGGETHFHLIIVSDDFAGKSRIQRQQMIYRLLREEMEERVHALSMVTMTVEEAIHV